MQHLQADASHVDLHCDGKFVGTVQRSQLLIRFQNSLVISRSPEEVFAFLSDFGNMPMWNHFLLETVKAQTSPTDADVVYHQVKGTGPQLYEITESQPCSVLTITTVPPAIWLRMRFSLEPVETGTLLTDEWEFETGYTGLIETISAGGVKSSVSESLNILRDLLEKGEVRLRDGRTISR